MYENENEQSIESDVSPQESSSDTPTPSTSGEPAQSQDAPAKTEQPNDANVPFHQHPRWIERDNELKSERQARQALEAQIKEIQGNLSRQQTQQAPVTQKEQDALVARLKGIDPEFGERFEQMDATRAQLQEMREWRQQMEASTLRAQVQTSLSSLHEQNKVAPEDRALYEQVLRAKAVELGPNARLEDLPLIYKDVHEMFSKRTEALKRAERESYVKAKAADARTPTSQSKGTPVNTSAGEEYSKDPETARQQAVSRIVKQMKAEQGI